MHFSVCGRCGVFSKGSVYVEKIGMECIPQFTGVWRSRGVGMECVCVFVFNWVLLEACGSAPTSALSANVLYEAAGA